MCVCVYVCVRVCVCVCVRVCVILLCCVEIDFSYIASSFGSSEIYFDKLSFAFIDFCQFVVNDN